MEELQENLINITLGGSRGKNIGIDGWSDYDIYIIVNKISLEVLNKLNEKLKNTIDIHVGITVYTKKEVENKLVDDKTKVMIYEHIKYKKNPVLFGEDIWFPITLEEIKKIDVIIAAQTLHTLKRELSIEQFEKKKALKKMTLLIKCLLRKNDIYAFGYIDGYEKFCSICEKKGIIIDDIKQFKVINYIKDINFNKIEQFKIMEKYFDFILDNIDVF